MPGAMSRAWGGLRLRVHPVFLVLLAAAVAGGMGREVLALCVVLAGHELAHLLVASAFRLRVASAEILPFGGVLRLEGLDLADPGVEAAVALAGPVHNLLWLGAGFALREIGWLRPDVGTFFLGANAVVGAGNLLPALPLDGGRAVQAMLAVDRGRQAATRAVSRAGYVLAAVLLAAGAALLLRAVCVPGLFIFGAFVAMRAGPERREARVRPWRELARRGGAIATAGLYPVRPLAVAPGLALRDLVQQFAPRAYHIVWIVDGAGAASGPWDEADVWRALRDRGARAPAEVLAEPARPQPP